MQCFLKRNSSMTPAELVALFEKANSPEMRKAHRLAQEAAALRARVAPPKVWEVAARSARERQTTGTHGCERRPRRGRAPRRPGNAHHRGSRRIASRSAGGGSSGSRGDPDDDPEPPRLRLWRHPKWGACSPNLLKLLIREGQQ